MRRLGAVTTELTAVLIGTAALAIPLTAIAVDRSAVARLDRRSADLEILQNALDAARRRSPNPLPSGWTMHVSHAADGVEAVTVRGPGGQLATTLRAGAP